MATPYRLSRLEMRKAATLRMWSRRGYLGVVIHHLSDLQILTHPIWAQTDSTGNKKAP